MLHIFVNIWYVSAVGCGHSNVCIVVSCLNFHLPDDIWYKKLKKKFYIYLFAICTSLVKRLLKVFALFFNWNIFLLLIFKSSLCILYNSSLPDTYLQIFSPSLSYCLDIVFFRAEVFNFNEVQLINFFFKFFIHLLWERDREKEQAQAGGGGGAEGEREKQIPHWAGTMM